MDLGDLLSPRGFSLLLDLTSAYCQPSCSASTEFVLDAATAGRLGLRAVVAAKKTAKTKPKPVVIGRGNAKGKGKLAVKVKLTSSARKKLKRAKTVTVTSVTTVVDGAGRSFSSRRTLKLKR